MPTGAAASPAARGGTRSAALAALLVLAVTAPLLLAFHARHPLLYDTDAFYHLAVARAMAHQGVLHDLPWLRLSALGPGFGDKELLFHALLAPFAAAADPLAGGRLALALFEALVLAAMAWIGWRAVGAWGLLAPAWLVLGSLETSWRLVRLRPELLSLLLLLAALAAAGSGRHRLLGALAAVYALAYTAFHALLGLCWALFLFRGWVRRRWELPLLLYPLLGTLAGLLVHPGFPHNLLVWKLQNVDHFALVGAYAPSQEMASNRTDVLLLANLAWWLGALAIWRSRARVAASEDAAGDAAARSRAGDLADAFGLAAAAFGGLYLLVSRFSVYFFPLATLWLLLELARRGETIGPRVALPGRGALPTALALALVALVALPGAARELDRFARRTTPGPGAVRLVDRVAMARAVPAGATVAAPWGDTPIYMLWAPQGRYTNALDPVFMAAGHPRSWAAEQAVFAGTEPDVPLATATDLESGWLAWSTPAGSPRLLTRLRNDPRARPLHVGLQALFALQPAPAGVFRLDWRVVPAAAAPARRVDASWPLYPRASGPTQALEGYVDARRVAGGGCAALAGAALAPGRYELAASGRTELWSGDTLALATGGNGAVLGEGVLFAAPASAAPLTVLTCPDGDGRAGFYLLRR